MNDIQIVVSEQMLEERLIRPYLNTFNADWIDEPGNVITIRDQDSNGVVRQLVAGLERPRVRLRQEWTSTNVLTVAGKAEAMAQQQLGLPFIFLEFTYPVRPVRVDLPASIFWGAAAPAPAYSLNAEDIAAGAEQVSSSQYQPILSSCFVQDIVLEIPVLTMNQAGQCRLDAVLPSASLYIPPNNSASAVNSWDQGDINAWNAFTVSKLVPSIAQAVAIDLNVGAGGVSIGDFESVMVPQIEFIVQRLLAGATSNLVGRFFRDSMEGDLWDIFAKFVPSHRVALSPPVSLTPFDAGSLPNLPNVASRPIFRSVLALASAVTPALLELFAWANVAYDFEQDLNEGTAPADMKWNLLDSAHLALLGEVVDSNQTLSDIMTELFRAVHADSHQLFFDGGDHPGATVVLEISSMYSVLLSNANIVGGQLQEFLEVHFQDMLGLIDDKVNNQGVDIATFEWYPTLLQNVSAHSLATTVLDAWEIATQQEAMLFPLEHDGVSDEGFNKSDQHLALGLSSRTLSGVWQVMTMIVLRRRQSQEVSDALSPAGSEYHVFDSLDDYRLAAIDWLSSKEVADSVGWSPLSQVPPYLYEHAMADLQKDPANPSFMAVAAIAGKLGQGGYWMPVPDAAGGPIMFVSPNVRISHEEQWFADYAKKVGMGIIGSHTDSGEVSDILWIYLGLAAAVGTGMVGALLGIESETKVWLTAVYWFHTTTGIRCRLTFTNETISEILWGLDLDKSYSSTELTLDLTLVNQNGNIVIASTSDQTELSFSFEFFWLLSHKESVPVPPLPSQPRTVLEAVLNLSPDLVDEHWLHDCAVTRNASRFLLPYYRQTAPANTADSMAVLGALQAFKVYALTTSIDNIGLVEMPSVVSPQEGPIMLTYYPTLFVGQFVLLGGIGPSLDVLVAGTMLGERPVESIDSCALASLDGWLPFQVSAGATIPLGGPVDGAIGLVVRVSADRTILLRFGATATDTIECESLVFNGFPKTELPSFPFSLEVVRLTYGSQSSQPIIEQLKVPTNELLGSIKPVCEMVAVVPVIKGTPTPSWTLEWFLDGQSLASKAVVTLDAGTTVFDDPTLDLLALVGDVLVLKNKMGDSALLDVECRCTVANAVRVDRVSVYLSGIESDKGKIWEVFAALRAAKVQNGVYLNGALVEAPDFRKLVMKYRGPEPWGNYAMPAGLEASSWHAYKVVEESSAGLSVSGPFGIALRAFGGQAPWNKTGPNVAGANKTNALNQVLQFVSDFATAQVGGQTNAQFQMNANAGMQSVANDSPEELAVTFLPDSSDD